MGKKWARLRKFAGDMMGHLEAVPGSLLHITWVLTVAVNSAFQILKGIIKKRSDNGAKKLVRRNYDLNQKIKIERKKNLNNDFLNKS